MQSALKMQSQKLVLFCLWAFLVGSALLAQDIQVNTYTTERQGGTDIAMAPARALRELAGLCSIRQVPLI